MVLAGNWLEGNLGKKNIFHGEIEQEDGQTITNIDNVPKQDNSTKQEGSVIPNLAKQQKQDSEKKVHNFEGSPKCNESSHGLAKDNCKEENPRESQGGRNDSEALIINASADCNSFFSSEDHSPSLALPPEDQSLAEYNDRYLPIANLDNLDNQQYSPDHSCDNQQHPPGRTLGQQVARCHLTRSMYNF